MSETATIVGERWRATMTNDGLREIRVEFESTERPEFGSEHVVELPGGLRFRMRVCGYSGARFSPVWSWELCSTGAPIDDAVAADIVLEF